MKTLEQKFGKPHPELEGFKEPLPQFSWLPESFFRLHRRRQHHESGFQPFPLREIADFGRHVLRLDNSLQPLFFRCMEETDNAVLYDHYTKAKEASEAAAEGTKRPKSRRR
ncbi:hypothetical protein OF001_U20289 [Pseudomonas sp. OF001]|uniref:hypothetical protein n=1 Tax=Pseudomonas sp. OF001 TaxID=2772300 RepID=UPI00191981EA|nr:hypothetical protein [Pseudomonas sp. OF001]CAD5377362.1 hypothetical protein OF001_U20289 [Pseudomonas sp. OF001]